MSSEENTSSKSGTSEGESSGLATFDLKNVADKLFISTTKEELQLVDFEKLTFKEIFTLKKPKVLNKWNFKELNDHYEKIKSLEQAKDLTQEQFKYLFRCLNFVKHIFIDNK